MCRPGSRRLGVGPAGVPVNRALRQLDQVAARFNAGLARHAPIIAGGEPVGYRDVDDTI
ncbi:hypothetical protein [Jatrophihabitans lederbergiae]|uniref:Uncharacterized protein n=1 Tax=Jatrophihabitans lederbergiae TaxID=3075547 RepID=A0ABU2JEX5_9ACTN|nr:hypothetical protein [Jatrophihabitans sp. DSM 44399]MDT0263549.1 hypothetical protein [Jatrophihabitans sp. DSM 44399]